MDHQEIENGLIFDRYLKGRLTPEEEERFEEHYLGCAECLDQLEAAQGLERGLRRAFVQDVAEIAAARRLGWLARLARSPGAGLLAVAAILAVGLPTWLAFRNSEMGRELGQQTLVIDQQKSKTASLENELTRERDTNQALTERLNQQSGVPTYELSRFRSSLLGDPEPAQTISLSAVEEPLVFSLPLDQPASGTHRIRLIDDENREIMRLDRELIREGTLAFSVMSSQLEEDDYVVRVESLSPGAEPVTVARFAFRVVAHTSAP